MERSRPVTNAEAVVYTPTTLPSTWYWANLSLGGFVQSKY